MLDSKSAIKNQLASLGLSNNFVAAMLQISPASLSGYFSGPRELPRAIEHQLRDLILRIEALKLRAGPLFNIMHFNGNANSVQSILQKIDDGYLKVFVEESDPNKEELVPEQTVPEKQISATGVLELEPLSDSASALSTAAVNSK